MEEMGGGGGMGEMGGGEMGGGIREWEGWEADG